MMKLLAAAQQHLEGQIAYLDEPDSDKPLQSDGYQEEGSRASGNIQGIEFDRPAALPGSVHEELPYALPTNGIVPLEWFRYSGRLS